MKTLKRYRRDVVRVIFAMLFYVTVLVSFIYFANGYENYINEMNEYCENVKAGFYPDYKKIYNTNCKNR